MRRHLAALILILLPFPPLAGDYPARVVGATDGDTLTVLKADKTQVKIRLSGVDDPETGQDFGSRAKQAASELAFGKDVTIREADHDRYGRTVAEVILPDGRSLGCELVGQGLAWWYWWHHRATENWTGWRPSLVGSEVDYGPKRTQSRRATGDMGTACRLPTR